MLSFLGAETTSEIEKLRGGAYHGVIVDECKSFNPIVLSELVEDVIRPALADHNGKLILIGTPGRDLRGIFYEATQQPSPLNVAGRPTNSRYGSGIEAEWSSHHWDARDNVAMPNIWKDFLATKRVRVGRMTILLGVVSISACGLLTIAALCSASIQNEIRIAVTLMATSDYLRAMIGFL